MATEVSTRTRLDPSIFRLPVSEYPEVAPPQIVVRAQFPGANPRVISETVATPLEEQINGIENLLYFDSLSNNGNLSSRGDIR